MSHMVLDLSRYPSLKWLAPLPPEGLQPLEIVRFKPREYLMREGEVGRMHLYFILEGVCVNDKEYPQDGRLFVARKVVPGEFIGLQEIIAASPERRVTSVVAKTPVTALQIPGAEFLRWQLARPELYNFIIHSVLSLHFDVRTLNMICAAKDTLKSGAYYLHYLYGVYAKGCHRPGYEGPVRIWDTRQEISVALSRDVRSVDRLISALRGRGCISVEAGKITVTQAQARQLYDLGAL
jgi:CRP-like cAMP-binding protein